MVFPMGGRGIPGNKMPEPLDEDKKSKLDKYGTDLTKLAEEGKLDSIVGRHAEIECVIKTFGRMKRKNPCLIGEHGVGKTTIVHGLIQRIASGDVPETIKGKKVIALNINLLVADANFKRIKERLKKLLEEIKERGDIILFLDDVHTIIGKRDREGELDGVPFMKPALERGNIKLFRDDVHTIIGKRDREGELDGVPFLKPALESGELKCIAATTPDEYKKLIETDPVLEWQFQQVKVLEPTVDETILILEGQRERYEHHHKLRYTDEALAAAAHLSYRYISDSFLPHKAINLLDEVGSHVRMLHHSQPSEVKSRELDKELEKITEDYNEAIRGRNFQNARDLLTQEKELKTRILALKEEGKERLIVKEMDIKHIISSWTGIPIGMIMNHDSDRLLKMEETLHKHIIGQEEVVKGISHAIIHAFMGMEDPRCRPIASFIFLGPMGNAKSEMASAVAASYFGSKEAMICLDMSDFMECHTALSLVGSPRGYVEGQLTAAVRKHPYTVVLFNEIEKAHTCVLDAIQWILKTGSLTDGKGQAIDFRNTILIMTSNIGSNIIVEKSQCGYEQIKSLIIEELRKHFQPEFIDQLVELIIFRQPEEIHSAIIDVDSDINVAAQNGDATIVANDMLEMATGHNKRPHDHEKNGYDA